MNATTRKVLLDLVAKNDVASIVYVLEALSKAQIDSDHDAVLQEAVRRISLLAPKMKPEERSSLRTSFTPVAAQVGPAAALELIATSKAERTFMDLLLPAISLEQVIGVAPAASGWLDDISLRDGHGIESAVWLARVAEGAAGASASWLKPLLRSLGSDEANPDPDVLATATSVASRPVLVEEAKHAVLESDGPIAINETIGLFRLIELTADIEQVEAIGPYIEDAGAWAYVSRTLFTRSRVSNLQRRFKSSGLIDLLLQAAEAGDIDSLGDRISKDPRFHSAVARLLGSRESLFGIARLFVDSGFVAAVKAIVSDRDAPIRLAAVSALGVLNADSAVPYLLSGVIDRNRDVRTAAQDSLKKILGEERYAEEIESLNSEVSYFRRQLQGLGAWAGKAKESV